MYATNFYGNGGTLDGIDNTKIVDTNLTTRAQATTSGVTITGLLSNNGNIQLTAATPEIELNSDGPRLRVPSANTLCIHTAGGLGNTDNERLRVDSNGVQVIFNDSMRFEVQDTVVKVGDPTLTDVNLEVTGDITAFSTSDNRLKDSVSPITAALEKVKSISGNTFVWKENDAGHEGEDTGVIAQEIEALGIPGVTITRGSGYLAVNYEKLIPLLIESIKELSAKVDTLENQINN